MSTSSVGNTLRSLLDDPNFKEKIAVILSDAEKE